MLSHVKVSRSYNTRNTTRTLYSKADYYMYIVFIVMPTQHLSGFQTKQKALSMCCIVLIDNKNYYNSVPKVNNRHYF